MQWRQPGSIALLALALATGSAAAQTAADVTYSAESVAKGRALFMSNCTQCHGNDGKSQVDVISDATDLTEPALYRNGKSDADILKSIRDGRGGVMPAYGALLKSDESLGHLRNFIKSLWPAGQRPVAGK
jgi:cbb3-type cytochrome c oxidase subunit III